MQSWSSPPTSTTRSRRNRPNAPEMMSSPPSRDQPVRPSRNARRYSTTWMRGSQRRGMRTSTMRPATTVQPLATRTTPPVATMRSGSSANGFATDSSACGSRIESASTMQTSGCRARLMPVFRASVLPPFSLRTTTSGSGPRAGHVAPTSTAPTRRHVRRDDPRHLDEVELVAQPVERVVGRAVVDDDRPRTGGSAAPASPAPRRRCRPPRCAPARARDTAGRQRAAVRLVEAGERHAGAGAARTRRWRARSA